MYSISSSDIPREAERIYEHRLKHELEKTNPDDFVSIEPVSGDYFLGRTLTDAIRAARKAHPDRLCHTVRVGHCATVHFSP